jgi:hypothetical protein
MADPDGDAAKFWSPELRAMVQSLGYQLSDDDIALRQEAELAQAAANYKHLANAPRQRHRVKKKKKKHGKHNPKSRKTPAPAVREPSPPGRHTSGLMSPPALPPTYASVVPESRPPHKRPAETITSPISPGDPKLPRLTHVNAPDSSSDAVQIAVRNLLCAMQSEQNPPASPAISMEISCTATERPVAQQLFTPSRRVHSDSGLRAYSVISDIHDRPSQAARPGSPLPSTVGDGSHHSDPPCQICGTLPYTFLPSNARGQRCRGTSLRSKGSSSQLLLTSLDSFLY